MFTFNQHSFQSVQHNVTNRPYAREGRVINEMCVHRRITTPFTETLTLLRACCACATALRANTRRFLSRPVCLISTRGRWRMPPPLALSPARRLCVCCGVPNFHSSRVATRRRTCARSLVCVCARAPACVQRGEEPAQPLCAPRAGTREACVSDERERESAHTHIHTARCNTLTVRASPHLI